ncbi:MAG: CDP-alcohol phosphatidyltransferase family protein [Erysipelotrichaceae bacterium]|nr:CDP-alcohol phosphatidyltransferase family protein [Erysipelotrichaceae bacterium]
MIRKNLANIITIIRIIGTICLLPLETLSDVFFYVYILTGITDALDGFVARKLHTVSRLGSKLDSAADLTFYSVMMCKIWLLLVEYLPDYVILLIKAVLVLRAVCYALIALFKKEFSSRHTILNKLTGLLLFLLPMILKTPYLLYYSLFVLLIAYISLFDEIRYLFKKKETA